MGVEYKHWFIAGNLNWTGDEDAARRVHDVLCDWGLAADAPTLYSLDGGRKKRLRGKLGQLAQPPDNLMAEYPEIESESVAKIMGPSYYPEDEIGPRYFQNIAVIIGTDFRVYDGHETTYTEVTDPPTTKGKSIKPYSEFLPHSFDVYSADSKTAPPTTTFEVSVDGWPVPVGFRGIWRCGLLLDCGKDLPAMMGKKHRVPSRKFASQMEKAFGTKLVQIGHYY